MRAATLRFLLRLVTGCEHERESWPMRLPGEAVAHRTCLECGRRRPYDLFEPPRRRPPQAGAPQVRPLPLRLLSTAGLAGSRASGVEKGKLLAA